MSFNRKVAYKIAMLTNKYPFKGSHRLSAAVSKLLLDKPKDGSQVIETAYGQKLHVNPIKYKGIDESFYYSGTYEPGVLNIIEKVLEKGDTFIGIGGNIGSMEVFAAKSVGAKGAVYTFEPDPELVEIIEKNAKINNLKNIYVQPYGLGSKKSQLSLSIKEDVNRGASSLLQQEDTDKQIKVKVDTFDFFISRVKPKNIKMILIDVEGWELEVLNGAKKFFEGGNRPILSIECVKEYKPEKIFNYVKALKEYRFFKLEKGKANISNLVEIFAVKDLPYEDNIFCLTENHLKKLSIS